MEMEQVPPTFPCYTTATETTVSEFTPVMKDKFLEWLRRTGLYAFSCEMVGIDKMVVESARKQDERFDRLCQAAREGYADSLVVEAHRRAVEGVDRPVIGGRNRDEIVTYTRVYSDKLLQSLLRAYKEEFKDTRQPVTVDVGATNRGVLILPSKLEGTEWEQEHGAADKEQP